MPQRDKKKIAGQQRAIREHEAKRDRYPNPQDKAFAEKTIRNATGHLNKLQKKGK